MLPVHRHIVLPADRRTNHPAPSPPPASPSLASNSCTLPPGRLPPYQPLTPRRHQLPMLQHQPILRRKHQPRAVQRPAIPAPPPPHHNMYLQLLPYPPASLTPDTQSPPSNSAENISRLRYATAPKLSPSDAIASGKLLPAAPQPQPPPSASTTFSSSQPYRTSPPPPAPPQPSSQPTNPA